MQGNRHIRVNRDVIAPEVLASLRGGDQISYNRIYVRYYDPLLRFVETIIKSHEHAQEIVQEVFIDLWLKREKIDPQKNFNGLIYRLARNKTIDYIKQTRRDKESPMPEVDITEFVDGEDVLIAKEIRLIIELSIANMPDQRRRIFEMSYYQGMSAEKIADELQIKKNSVQQQISLGRNDLRKTLKLLTLLMSISLI